MNMRIAVIPAVLAGTLVMSAASCEQIAAATGSIRRPAQTIFITQTYDAPFDARKGDTVNVIMEPSEPDPGGWCNQRGGSLFMNPYTDILICEHIDF